MNLRENDRILGVVGSQAHFFDGEELSLWSHSYMVQDCLKQLGSFYHFNPSLEIPTCLQVREEREEGWVRLLMFAYQGPPLPGEYEMTYQRSSQYFEVKQAKQNSIRQHIFGDLCTRIALDYTCNLAPTPVTLFTVEEKVERLNCRFLIKAVKLKEIEYG